MAQGGSAQHMTRSRQGTWVLPWWMTVTVIFLLGRLVSTVMLAVLAGNQHVNPWTGPSPSLIDFSSIWDGRWYNIIAEGGYPSVLPYTEDGHVGENQWAFLPVFPSLVRLVMALTTLPWASAAIVVSLGFGLGATLLLYALVRRVTNPGQALFTVILFSVAPTSALMQLAYAESLQMFLIALALYLLIKRTYWWILPVAVVLAFTRPGALALTLTLGLHFVYRWWRRKKVGFPRRDRVALIVVTTVSFVAGLAWPVIADMATNHPGAYIETELAWRSAYVGYTGLVIFTPWVFSGQWWLVNFFAVPADVALWGSIAVVAVLVVGFTIFLFLPATKRIGVDLRFWLASWALYLLAVFFPQSSTFRLLTPLFPALAVLATPRSRVYRVVMVMLFIVLQWFWLLIAWAVADYDWSPP